jgi:hypothetical protein
MNRRTRAPRRLSTRIVATGVLVLGALAVAAPALADRAEVRDPADATASLTDIRKVVVDHTPQRLLVKVRFTDLRRTSDGGPSSIGIFLDTDPDQGGPEFRLSSGLQSGTDYQLVRVESWKVVGEPLSCRHHVGLDFADDVLRFRAGHACLDDPAAARVAVKMMDMYDGSHPVVDWLGERRSFTRWVDAG